MPHYRGVAAYMNTKSARSPNVAAAATSLSETRGITSLSGSVRLATRSLEVKRRSRRRAYDRGERGRKRSSSNENQFVRVDPTVEMMATTDIRPGRALAVPFCPFRYIRKFPFLIVRAYPRICFLLIDIDRGIGAFESRA